NFLLPVDSFKQPAALNPVALFGRLLNEREKLIPIFSNIFIQRENQIIRQYFVAKLPVTYLHIRLLVYPCESLVDPVAVGHMYPLTLSATLTRPTMLTHYMLALCSRVYVRKKQMSIL